MAKNIRGFLENLFEYHFFNNIVNVNYFSDLNITGSTTLKYYHKQAISKKLKLNARDYEIFFEKFIGLWTI